MRNLNPEEREKINEVIRVLNGLRGDLNVIHEMSFYNIEEAIQRLLNWRKSAERKVAIVVGLREAQALHEVPDRIDQFAITHGPFAPRSSPVVEQNQEFLKLLIEDIQMHPEIVLGKPIEEGRSVPMTTAPQTGGTTFNIVNNGGVNAIGINGGTATQTVNSGIQPGDIPALRAYLKSHAIDDADLDELEAAIKEDPKPTGPNLGKRVSD